MGGSKSKNSINKFKFFKNPEKPELRLKKLENDQKEFILFNIGGEVFKISKNVILNCPYDLIFKNYLNHNNLEEIFIDRSNEDFNLILQIIRVSQNIKIINEYQSHSQYLGNIKNQIKNPEIFKLDLKFYFKKDYENLLKDFELSKKLEFQSLNEYIESFELEKEEKDKRLDYMQYRAKDIKELLNLYNRKAFFLNQNGYLIIIFSKLKLINKIELRPFIYDKQFWNDEESKIIKIHSKNEINEWVLVNEYEIYLDEENLAEINLKGVFTKEIKISSGCYDRKLSLAYLKIY